VHGLSAVAEIPSITRDLSVHVERARARKLHLVAGSRDDRRARIGDRRLIYENLRFVEVDRFLVADFRYAQMRRSRGDRFWLASLYLVFGLQGLLMWIVSLPIQLVQVPGATAAPLGRLDLLGFLLWGTGVAFEAIGDWQLARFRADPANRGRVCDEGLWAWTRHPNYFGDALMWWGLYCFAAAAGATWTAVGPVVMTVLLLEVSGVALLERSLRSSRPGYADYVARTSAFLPLPPRRRRMAPGP
jgi:steroid 5-alpha reductase family enzyme